MISAQIVLDSVSREGMRLTTMAFHYPRIVHSELMTHRTFSRNAASSRAIPVRRMIDMIERNPARPVSVGLDGKGMQDHGAMTPFGEKRAYELWDKACGYAVAVAKEMYDSPERPHKQFINRILEPYMHMTTIVTATDWENFFWLRDDHEADPTLAELAYKAHNLYKANKPALREPGEWHLPYVDGPAIDACIARAIQDQPPGPTDLNVIDNWATELAMRVSAARCARVSYLNHEGKSPTLDEDLKTYERLVGGRRVHASPPEHQATPDVKINDTGLWLRPQYHGNFTGWIQHRKLIPGEARTQRPYTGGTAAHG